MNPERKKKLAAMCDEVVKDMERDAAAIDGKPFDGRTVATHFGYQAAAIRALALAVKEIVES